ncbi:MAG TPA: hypothetical protein VGF08_04195 [Terriglobales bacterium]
MPANLVQAAARGALALPPEEMLEILVHLAIHNKVFGAQARMTLAGWDEKSALAAAGNPSTSPEVLQYLFSPENLRPALLPVLLENPSIAEEALIKMAVAGSKEIARAMLSSPRVNNSAPILNALRSNPNVGHGELKDVAPPTPVAESKPDLAPPPESEDVLEPASDEPAPAEPEDVLDVEIAAYLKEHAEEIEAEKDSVFQPIGGLLDEIEDAAPAPSAKAKGKSVSSSDGSGHGVKLAPKAAHPPGEEARRGSALQKISKLDVKGRIQLAMKGTKEERSILIRDGTKIVALAVLDSPKISDGEVEAFASQKNVLEAVLRGIPMKRKYAKHYPVIRNLVFNPRTPLDLSLGLMKNILVNDLRNLSSNKEVSDTVRKLALKMFKQKSETKKKSD